MSRINCDDYQNYYNYKDTKEITDISRKIFINSLDIYIVSSGGVGSEYIAKFLSEKGINTGYITKTLGETENKLKYSDIINNNVCHHSSKLIRNKKTLYLYGDIINSIISQYNRGYLHINATKIHFGRDYNHHTLEYFLNNFPNDPIGIKKQYNNFKNTTNTIMIKYPYKKEDIENAMKTFGYNIDFSDFVVKHRNKNFNNDLIQYPNNLQRIISIYKSYNFDENNFLFFNIFK